MKLDKVVAAGQKLREQIAQTYGIDLHQVHINVWMMNCPEAHAEAVAMNWEDKGGNLSYYQDKVTWRQFDSDDNGRLSIVVYRPRENDETNVSVSDGSG